MNSRQESRYRADEQATLTVLGNPDVQMPSRVLNVSRSGVRLEVNRAVRRGAPVRLEWDKHFLVGKAVHVSAARGGYQVGLELLTCSSWRGPNRAGFLPLRLKAFTSRLGLRRPGY